MKACANIAERGEESRREESPLVAHLVTNFEKVSGYPDSFSILIWDITACKNIEKKEEEKEGEKNGEKGESEDKKAF